MLSYIEEDEFSGEALSQQKTEGEALAFPRPALDNHSVNARFASLLNFTKDLKAQRSAKFLAANVHSSSPMADKTPKRLRKNQDQHQILLNEFNKTSNWTKEQITALSSRLGLKQSQIYKWNWDMQRKIRNSSLCPNLQGFLSKAAKRGTHPLALLNPATQQALLQSEDVVMDEGAGQ